MKVSTHVKSVAFIDWCDEAAVIVFRLNGKGTRPVCVLFIIQYFLSRLCDILLTIYTFCDHFTYTMNTFAKLFVRSWRSEANQRLLLQRFYAAGGTGSKENLDRLVKNEKVVVFMKGVPEQPMCGFSNAVVQILRMHGVEKYDSHNVLEDEELRQGKDIDNRMETVVIISLFIK